MSDETASASGRESRVRPTATYRAVLVPLDGSGDAERAVGPGGWLAGHFGADLHVISADVRRDERFWYEPYLDGVCERVPGGAVPHATGEMVVPAIRELARELAPCLVCAATHGRSRSAALLGSTFASLAAASAEPLVAIGPASVPHNAPDPRRVVACLDGSVPSERVVAPAAAWARALHCTLSLVTVVEPDGDAGPGGYLDRLTLGSDLADLTVDTLALRSAARPHVALMAHLEERPATLLAVTTQSRTGLSRAVIGSEAARIIHDSPVPVLVQPTPPH